MAVHARPAPARPSRRPAMPGAIATTALGLALFVGILAFREGDPHVSDADEILFVLPIALLALRFGLRGGLASALTGFALIVSWDLYDTGATITLKGYVIRGVAFLVLGVLLGLFVDRRHDAESQVAARTGELEVARTETLQRLALAGEYRDDDTSQHTERVGTTAAEIGIALGLGTDQVDLLREAATLHDVGKLAISDTILLKPGKLTEQEYEVMKTHAALGARLLSGSSSPVLQMAEVIAATHHEWLDGTGYPDGLAGEDIPLVGRVVAVADVFDALTHDRPYKSAWPVKRATAEIQRASGSQFDPRVVAAFLGIQEDIPVFSETDRRQQGTRTVLGPRQRPSRPTTQPAPRSAQYV
jgi:HD domain